MAWKLRSGSPNCRRSAAYAVASSSAERAMPIACAAMPSLPFSSDCKAYIRPLPSAPRRWSAGTRSPSKMSCTVGDARRPILSSFLPTRKPGMSGVTMKVEMPFRPRRASVLSVRAMARMTPAWVPLVTHDFVPSITQWSPSRTACALSDAASEPASGSDSAKAPSSSPRAIGRR